MTAPYLSLVACSRNDDHGGRTWERMTASLECTFHQLEKHRIDSEYIMIEWNPPPDRPHLRDAVPWPTGLRHVSIRVITVGPSIHRRYKLHPLWNLLSPLAFNVGLRRARGKFAALSMIDHLYSDEIMSLLASRSLRTDRSYRFPRTDIRQEVLEVRGVHERLAYCGRNILGTAQPSRRLLRRLLLPLLLEACGDFQLLPLNVWHDLRGYRERDLMPQHVDSFVHCAAQALGLKEEVLWDRPLYHIDHSGGWNRRKNREKLGSIRFPARYIPPPVTPEDRRHSFLYRLLLLETKPLVQREMMPYYNVLFLALARGWISHRFNNEAWGLAGESLEEASITKGHWDR